MARNRADLKASGRQRSEDTRRERRSWPPTLIEPDPQSAAMAARQDCIGRTIASLQQLDGG